MKGYATSIAIVYMLIVGYGVLAGNFDRFASLANKRE